MTSRIGHNSQNRQTVYRRHGNRAHTAILNSFLQDSRISHETKGLVAEMLSYPEDWDFTVQYLTKNGKSGRDKVYRMLKEAEKFGYIVPFKYRALDGKIQKQTYLVSDDPEALIRAVADEILELEKDGQKRKDFDYPEPSPGTWFVYVLERGGDVKVGITKSPRNRVSSLNASERDQGRADPVFFYATSGPSAGNIERIVHFKLKDFHIKGEWFSCSPDDAIQAIKLASGQQVTENPEMADLLPVNQVTENPDTASQDEAPQVPDIPDRASPDTVFPTQTNNIYNKNTQNKLSPNGLLSNKLDGHEPPIVKRKKKTVSDLYTEDFNHFWSLYPKREGKGEAARSWHKLSMDEKRRAYSGLKKQLPLLERKMQADGGKYCPMPATWINQGRFDDDPKTRTPDPMAKIYSGVR